MSCRPDRRRRTVSPVHGPAEAGRRVLERRRRASLRRAERRTRFSPSAASSRIIIRAMRMKAALFTALLAAPTVLAQSQTIRIHAATVIDGSGKALRNATIVVQGSKITSIETGNTASATYDLGQLTVLPGMIDVHAHGAWHFDKDG